LTTAGTQRSTDQHSHVSLWCPLVRQSQGSSPGTSGVPPTGFQVGAPSPASSRTGNVDASADQEDARTQDGDEDATPTPDEDPADQDPADQDPADQDPADQDQDSGGGSDPGQPSDCG
jgi:hypothetical protein